jgi:pimeloyl-ACP methyl ester carboxylesterase
VDQATFGPQSGRFIRHTHSTAADPLTWDETGQCRGESVLSSQGKLHARKIGAAFAQHRVTPGALIALVSHSMGSRMTHYYLTRDPDPRINAWVCIGWGSEGDFGRLKFPVLDLYGTNDLPSVLKGAQRRAASINDPRRSRQIMAPRADHFFTNQQAALVRYVREFLDTSL